MENQDFQNLYLYEDAKDPVSYKVILWNWTELETMWVGGWMIERELNSEEKDYLKLELEKNKFNI